MNIIDSIKASGVVGAGGAGFPTHAKVSGHAVYVLMNAAECEPLLGVVLQLLVLYTVHFLLGFDAVAMALQAEHAIIGIKKKHSDVIAVLRSRIAGLSLPIAVREMPDFYPAGDEQVLVYELTGRIVPEGGIPLQVGCVVINVETVLNVSRALAGKAVTDSYLTVAGAVPHPLTMRVPVGTPLAAVVAKAGLTHLDGYAVIDGGPMMGRVLSDLHTTVMKKTKGYIVLPKDHPLIIKKTAPDRAALLEGRSVCEQCRMCTDLCPRYLLGHTLHPHRIMRAVKYNVAALDEVTQANLCSQCGVCTLFSCPAHLKPHQINFILKQKMGAHHIRYTPKTDTYQARPARPYRRLPVKRLIRRLGLYPYDQAAPFEDVAFAVKEVRLALSQHVGAPAVPVVSAGDAVEKGQLIAAIPEGALGAAVHASVSGTVTEITGNDIAIKVG